MSIRELAGRAAVLRALADAVRGELDAVTDQLRPLLAEAAREHGTRQVGACLPDGEEVATVSWVRPDPVAQVTDQEAFLGWVREMHPTEVETVVRVRAAFVHGVLKEATAAQVARWCDRESGELFDLPGVEMVGRAPYQRLDFRKREGRAVGREAVARAWREGRLGELPGLEGGLG